MEGGLSKEVPEHANYLEEVSEHLAQELRAIIQAIIEEDQNKVHIIIHILKFINIETFIAV